ncbi:ParA family protein [Chromatium okenii]|uniref:ParA family protein n=1 Tax=Chromatium okenii TaxID=61644 RepID=UPI0026EF4CC8|nr:ParA family protein [Chromatium okenii]MBV5308370.1 ParA family protein [Chromatium okenii]
MTIFACVNTKGGVGKTTTAVHLAVMLARQQRSLLIDGDPQASAASWAAWRRERIDGAPSPTTVCLSGKAIITEGKPLAQGYVHVVVDAGGRDSVGLRSALLLAEYAIIPVGASQLDAAALTDVMTVVDLARDYNPNLDVRILLTRVDPRTKDAADMLVFLKSQNLVVLNTMICERVAFRRAIGEGATVHEIGKDHLAISEVEAFFQEVVA